MSRSPLALAGSVLVCVLASPGVSAAQGNPGGGHGGGGGNGGGGGGPTQSPTGYDISYPQCGSSYPSNVLFGIVGVNDGIVYSPNPCLASELSWAWAPDDGNLLLYANTADPGPSLSSHWPDGQTSPQPCNTADNSGPDTPQCSYDYGWNAAADSYQDALDAYSAIGQPPTSQQWWLDVETANSWEANTDNNVNALQGAVAYFESKGVAAVGIYASANDWQTITGDSSALSSLPYWQHGSRRESTAQSYCGTTGVTGGPVTYSQYFSGGYDADVRC
jgi:hypothetical protein